MSGKSSFLALGLMSGTSMDGIDAVLARYSQAGDETIAHCFFPYPRELRAQLGQLVDRPEISLNDFGAIDFAIGDLFGKAAHACWLAGKKKAKGKLDLVGSHGQTVFHNPARKTSIQIGCPQAIAARTGTTVVADFRRADIIAGGEGAPLLPLYHKRLFTQSRAGVAVHNLGGISNFTYFGPKGRLIALDTGPANCLMDMAVEHFSSGKQRFDRGGQLARRGEVHESILGAWLTDSAVEDYRKRPAPKSTGRELYTRELLKHWLSHPTVKALSEADILATLAELTVELAAEAYERFVLKAKLPLKEIIFTGGGAKNPALLERFARRLPKVKVSTVAELGVAPEVVEAQAFGYYGLLALLGKAQSLPAATGAKSEVVGGVIVPGENWSSLYQKVYSVSDKAFRI